MTRHVLVSCLVVVFLAAVCLGAPSVSSSGSTVTGTVPAGSAQSGENVVKVEIQKRDPGPPETWITVDTDWTSAMVDGEPGEKVTGKIDVELEDADPGTYRILVTYYHWVDDDPDDGNIGIGTELSTQRTETSGTTTVTE